MTKDEMVEALAENEALLADGFEDALIGYAERFSSGPIAMYDKDKCLGILMQRDGLSWDEASEFFEFNVQGAWVGDKTPVYVSLISA